MGHFFASVSTLVLLSGLTLGQSSKDRFEVFGGYSLVTGDFTGTFLDRNNSRVLNGWNASANFKAGRLLGFVADLSGYYPSDTGVGFRAKSHSFLFGPQVSVPLSRVTPFAHALLGVTHIGYQPSGFCPRCVAYSAHSSLMLSAVGLTSM